MDTKEENKKDGSEKKKIATSEQRVNGASILAVKLGFFNTPMGM